MNRQPHDNRYDPPQTGHPGHTPGIGFTPPVAPPAAPQPQGMVSRSRQAWTNYSTLRQRARANSMAWWGYKLVQGFLLGGIPFALGVIVDILAALSGAGAAITGIGAVIMLAGLAIMLRYALAPVTARWIVTVPENRYCVVEDYDGYTLEYLEPGRLIVPWRWKARVRDYVAFNTVTAHEIVMDVLNVDPPVDLEVTVIMAFNPSKADPEYFAALRSMTARETFETMIARDVRDSVRIYLGELGPRQQQNALRSPRLIEEAVADALERHAVLGLTLASSRPVMVHVRGGAFPEAPPAADAIRTGDHDVAGVAGEGEPAPDTLPRAALDRGAEDRARQTPPVRPRGDMPDPLARRRERRSRTRRADAEDDAT